MSLAQKLVLYALAVALVPMSAIGFSLVAIGESALRQRIEEHQGTAAAAVAAKVTQAVQAVAEHLVAVGERFSVQGLSSAEREGLARLLYRQSPDISVVWLHDPGGTPLSPPVYRPQGIDALADHLPVVEEHTDLFASQLRGLIGHGTNGVVMSSAYYPEDGGPARVALAVPCCGGDGPPAAVAAIELALRSDILRIEGIDTGPDSSLFVVDAAGRIIAHPSLVAGTSMRHHGAVGALLLEGGARGSLRVAAGESVLAASWARLPGLGWAVVVEQPESVAFAAASAMRRRVLFWIFATTAVVLASALIFAARLRQVLRRLVAGARAFGEGRLEERIELVSHDEIGALAATMNSMAGQLQVSLAELEAWGRTLERRVEERTEELKEAQAQLLTQSKLAAIGQLGAGVAHEVNNPLAGILGYTQLLIRRSEPDSKEHQMLQKIEEAAQRCKAITVNLLRFSERGLAGYTAIELNDIIAEVVQAFHGPAADNAIEVVEEYAAELPVIVANAGQLAVMLLNMLSNAKNAMLEGGGRLTITTRAAPEGGVALTVADSGHGIDPEHLPRIFEPFFTTKKVWTGVGLGLAVAYRIVADHGGRIEVQSEVGKGTTFEIFLPLTPPEETLANSSAMERRKAVTLE